jgi:hypothetical protein
MEGLMKIFLPLSAALIAATSLLAQDRHRPIDPDDAYKNNCMRCHTSVQQFSPRMTKTIMMHKRVRARLTAEETKAILKYLADNAGPKPVRRRGK